MLTLLKNEKVRARVNRDMDELQWKANFQVLVVFVKCKTNAYDINTILPSVHFCVKHYIWDYEGLKRYLKNDVGSKTGNYLASEYEDRQQSH